MPDGLMSLWGSKRRKSLGELNAELECNLRLLVKDGSQKKIERILEKVALTSAALQSFVVREWSSEKSAGKNDQDEKQVLKILEKDLLHLIISTLSFVDFECKKNLRSIFLFTARKIQSSTNLGLQRQLVKVCLERKQNFRILVEGLQDPRSVQFCGPILRALIEFDELCDEVVELEIIRKIFDLAQGAHVELSRDAFLTLRSIFLSGNNTVLNFLKANSNDVFSMLNGLVQSSNYCILRQGLKFLKDILLERRNYTVMLEYIQNACHLKIFILLLDHSSASIQHECFHMFKVFVGNPSKSPEILQLLRSEKPHLLHLLGPLQPISLEDDSFPVEKSLVLSTLTSL